MDKTPPFDPLTQEVGSWIAQFERRCRLLKIEDEERLEWAFLVIGPRGHAALGDPKDLTWAIAQTRLSTHFDGGDVTYKAINRLEVLTQGARSYDDLALEVRRLAYLGYPTTHKMAEHHALRAFRRCLPQELSFEVFRSDRNTVDEALQEVRRIEENNVKRSQNNSVQSKEQQDLQQRVIDLETALRRQKEEADQKVAYTQRQAPTMMQPYRGPGHIVPTQPRRLFECFACDRTGHRLKDCPIYQEFRRNKATPTPMVPSAQLTMDNLLSFMQAHMRAQPIANYAVPSPVLAITAPSTPNQQTVPVTHIKPEPLNY